MYNFQQYRTIRSSGNNIYICKANVVKGEEDQSNILMNIVESNNRSNKSKEGKDKKRYLQKRIKSL